jgi:hypothetical protein
MTKASKATKAPKASQVDISVPYVDAAWKVLVSKTQKIDASAQTAVLAFAKIVASRKVDVRSARKSVEALNLTSPILLTSQIEALPTLLELMAKENGFDTFKNMDIKTKLTKATAAYKLGVGIASKMDTWEAVAKEVKDFNARKNAGKSTTSSTDKKKDKKVVSPEKAIKSTLALVESLQNADIEDSLFDACVELYNALGVLVGVDA